MHDDWTDVERGDMSQRVVTIRGAARSDVPGIADVARKTWTATYAGIIPDEVQRELLESWYSAPALLRAIESPGAFLVATQAGHVIGFAQFVWQPPESAELTRIYVLPERQHVGVGTMLERMLRGEMPPPPAATLIGMRLESFAPGEAVVVLEPTPAHANPMGTVQGGILAA